MQHRWILFGLLFAAGSSIGAAGELRETGWQEERLERPSEKQRLRESHGQVFIYDGLEYGVVVRAMDEHFDRIQNMMFTQIHHPPPPGKKTGYVEDDGCE